MMLYRCIVRDTLFLSIRHLQLCVGIDTPAHSLCFKASELTADTASSRSHLLSSQLHIQKQNQKMCTHPVFVRMAQEAKTDIASCTALLFGPVAACFCSRPLLFCSAGCMHRREHIDTVRIYSNTGRTAFAIRGWLGRKGMIKMWISCSHSYTLAVSLSCYLALSLSRSHAHEHTKHT